MNSPTTQHEIQRFLQVAQDAAVKAGQFLMTQLGNVSVAEKNPGDFVTEADIEAQRLIQTHIADVFPNHGFIGEEDGQQLDGHDGFCWIVDPIDGTTNFIHQLPSFSVSIALRHHSDLIVGCIFDPMLDEMYTATTGNGAFLNGKPIKSSGLETTTRSIVVCSLPRGLTRESRELKQMINVICDSDATVRRLGSAALNLCYIACGRVDAYWSTLAKIWDIAAGIVILREAGGTIQGIDGGELDWEHIEFVASATEPLNRKLIEILAV